MEWARENSPSFNGKNTIAVNLIWRIFCKGGALLENLRCWKGYLFKERCWCKDSQYAYLILLCSLLLSSQPQSWEIPSSFTRYVRSSCYSIYWSDGVIHCAVTAQGISKRELDSSQVRAVTVLDLCEIFCEQLSYLFCIPFCREGCRASEDLFWKLTVLQQFIAELNWPDEVLASHLMKRLKLMASDMVQSCVKR